MSHAKDLIGVGWSFPVAIDNRGGIALSQGMQEIEEAIEIILGTPRGYRVMRPEFGCRIHELQFAPLNAGTMAAAAHYVQEALGWWEPRIDVLEILVDEDPDVPGCMLIYVAYRVRSTYDERALVYPFYSIPGEE
ncbi:MAG TPA: GPW/gp25 family protein [Herpetosiphonaceae bacterium]|nr:GPW/gp25 family protein [Herpetosiphonaceae bacterium]